MNLPFVDVPLALDVRDLVRPATVVLVYFETNQWQKVFVRHYHLGRVEHVQRDHQHGGIVMRIPSQTKIAEKYLRSPKQVSAYLLLDKDGYVILDDFFNKLTSCLNSTDLESSIRMDFPRNVIGEFVDVRNPQ